MIPTLQRSEKGKTMETVKEHDGFQGVRGGRMGRWSPEDFQGSGTTVYDTMMVAVYRYTFVKTCKRYNTKSKS